MKQPIELKPVPDRVESRLGTQTRHPGASGPASRPRRRSWFRRALHGTRWLAAAPREWLGASVIVRGAALISGLNAALRPAARDRRFKVQERGGFDVQATAFYYGITAAEVERRMVARQRQTATLAYILFGMASLLLLAWLRSALGVQFTGARLWAAIEFLPFCLMLYLMAFYHALINFQIRMRRTAGWHEYLTTDQPFLPRG